ncbi:MAG: PEP-CTERM sorting domain-containing protein [Acidobacteriaceae bacterium]|nr:PEP-CTERM sorting domain-containing protein [Acidobacteriaceae bacterium]
MLRTVGLSLIAVAITLMPGAVKADSITESFSLSIPTTTLTDTAPNGGENFPTTGFAEFNPAIGTLNSIAATLTGPATWSFGLNFILNASLLFNNSPTFTEAGINAFQSFESQGAISFDISTTNTFPDELLLVTGTGTTNFVLNLSAAGDTFSTTSPGLTGTITYNYTPAAAIPEPGSLTLLAVAGATTGLFALRRRRRNRSFFRR